MLLSAALEPPSENATVARAPIAGVTIAMRKPLDCPMSFSSARLGRGQLAAGFQTRIRAIAATICVLQGCGGRTSAPDETPVTDVDGGASVQGVGATSPTGSASSPSGSSMNGPPSCQPGGPGMTNCGPGGSGSESCCTSLEVVGGTYDRTYDLDESGQTLAPVDGVATGLADPATVSGFRMDKYLVTVGRFRRYVNYVTGTGGSPPANGSGIHTHLNGGLGLANSGNPGTYETGWDAMDWNTYIATGPGAANTWNANLNPPDMGPPTWTSTAASYENLPITCVNWYEAYAFCIWDGGFLPSEAEWEYVAAGGSQQRAFPWGATEPGSNTQYAIYDNLYRSNPTQLAPVGTTRLGAGYWGQLDMAGEVFEWNLDWYATYVDPCTDCAFLTEHDGRVARGGWNGPPDFLLVPSREQGNTTVHSTIRGFRCARTP